MTNRQKEMLINRALLEFLADHPELNRSDIDDYALISKITGNFPRLTFSHYVVYIALTNGKRCIYIPKERFPVKHEIIFSSKTIKEEK